MPFFTFFSATLKIPDNLPRYKKNAFTIYHQILSRIDELNVEVNHRKIQLASLFTSIQQVETEIRKEQETAEQHNRDKALFNLRKARFMKQMQNVTKKLKEQTILTHSFPMPKPTNATELTKKLLHDFPDEVPIPDINKDLEEELTKLGLNTTPLTNTNSPTNKGTLDNTPQWKLPSSPSSTSNQQESTTRLLTKKQTYEHKDVEQSKPPYEYEEIKQLPSQEVHKFQVSQLSSPVDKNEDTNTVIEASGNQSPSENTFHLHTKSLKLSRKDHIEAYPWAHKASGNFSKTTPLAGTGEVEFPNIAYASFRKYLTAAQREHMIKIITLPQASLDKIEKNIGMKKEDKTYFCKLCDPNTPYVTTRRAMANRHTRTHMGYSLYRCSFCNFISNNLTPIYSHYMLKHGIPKKWIDSQKI